MIKFNVTGPGEVDQAATPHGPAIFPHRPAGQRFFDSLAVEECGNICIATPSAGGITVVSPEGEAIDFVATGDFITTNICWPRPGASPEFSARLNGPSERSRRKDE